MHAHEPVDDLAQQLAHQVSERLPSVIRHLLEGGYEPDGITLKLECTLTAHDTGPCTSDSQAQVAAVDIGRDVLASLSAGRHSSRGDGLYVRKKRLSFEPPDDAIPSPTKRRKETGALRVVTSPPLPDENSMTAVQHMTTAGSPLSQPKKRTPDNPTLQPSSLEKLINGIWESVYCGTRLDPVEVIAQWQAIEASGQPKLLTDTEQEVSLRSSSRGSSTTGLFSRLNVLTRKVSQTSRTCRSLEVIVQAYWIQCFDERVLELTQSIPREKARKTAMTEACVDMNWTEKELRNKMAIWRGYHEIRHEGGWAALVFAGMGLYRFCKYRVSFTEETFQTLRTLRHRLEVAADTLHPRWRLLLGIVSEPVERKYAGHPHDWVVCGPEIEAIPLPETYRQWDENFSYVHLDGSAVDEEAWGEFDPRTVAQQPRAQGVETSTFTCQSCGEKQSDDPLQNACTCYPNLYGSTKASMMPVQVFRTPDGKNNGLLACCPFDQGSAVGEFIGEITSGIEGKDCMVGQTERATYQIWQGKQGNYTRFVNHSCEANSQFERFVWLGKQRVVLASNGIEAGEEVTVDYGETYWQNLDKICRCGATECRYRNRKEVQLLTAPSEERR